VRRYAQDTEVAISRSREQITQLLCEWSCEQIGWLDDFAKDRVLLQFVVPRIVPGTKDAIAFRAQFSIKLEPDAKLRLKATGARGFSDVRYADLMNRRGRREHRVLFLWIKAALEAVTEGIVPFEALFLPFLVREDGITVADAVMPMLHKALGAPAAKMLTAGAR
jgi:hypothetical protein